jgi:uncharacterized protein (TIGR03435 family)
MFAALLVAIASLAEQSAGPDLVEFDVVSVKLADQTAPGRSTQNSPAAFRGRNLYLTDLVMSAWGVNEDRIIGGPAWIRNIGWDIDARIATAGATPEQRAHMMQAMLADRFHLVTHRETRTMPIYELTVLKSGIRLQESSEGGQSSGPALIRFGSASMSDLARQLSNYVGREVVDRTGLSGRYAIRLSFAPASPEAVAASDAADPGPSIFQALQQQTGLKLEPAIAPVEFIVIDSVDKPAAN